jgi:Highly conserved protein containing a thioredoxin domain
MLQLKTLLQVKSSLHRAGHWFLTSGIQEDSGGVARYFHVDKGENARISTEITGYAVSAFLYLHARTTERAYLDAAIRAGHFLTRTAWDATLATFPFEHGPEVHQEYAYFFDCGIIIRGLVWLWRVTGDEEWLRVARQAGLSMKQDFAAPRLFHPILTLPDKQPVQRTPQWSQSPGCYQLKSALAWLDLHEAAHEQQFLDWYELALSEAMQVKDSFLPAPGPPEKTMDRLHAYCYFLEALLPRAGRPECRDALLEGIERVSNYLREIEPVFVRSDVYAQLLRVRLLSGIPVEIAQAEREAAAIESFQYADDDERLRGGFCFGRRQGVELAFANPVSTAFCAQALDYFERYQAGDALDRGSLI